MNGFIFYGIGCIIALIIGIYEAIISIKSCKDEEKDNLQLGMIAPMVLLSWLTVIMFVASDYKIRNYK